MKGNFIVILIFALVISICCLSCSNHSGNQKYADRVGDINVKEVKEKTGFEICGKARSIRQYYNFGKGLEYKGDRKALQEEIKSKYKAPSVNESGWIRVRFIVNCKGESGGFELLESDENYTPFVFDKSISDQLLKITAELDGWKILPRPDFKKDYYQYLIFKIKDGDITDIMP